MIILCRALAIVCRMTTFYFWLDECGSITEPMEGIELPDLASAVAYATNEARIFMGEEVRLGKLCLSCRIDIADEKGRHLETVLFSNVIVVSGVPPCSPFSGY